LEKESRLSEESPFWGKLLFSKDCLLGSFLGKFSAWGHQIKKQEEKSVFEDWKTL
jgi:hypothetical protein